MDALGPARWLSRAVSAGSAVRIGQQVYIVDRRGRGGPRASTVACSSAGSSRPSRWLSAAGTSATPPGPRGARPDLPQCAQAYGHEVLVIPLVMPAIPTNGLAQSGGIILAIRIIRPRGVLGPNARVSGRHVPNVGITGTIHHSPVIRLLGHRSTGRTTPTGPMIRLSPVDQVVCAPTRPFSALRRGGPGVSPRPRKARPGG